MDVYRNDSSYSADISFVESFVIREEVEDESLEWLSTYVEECLCDTTSYTTPLTCATTDSSGGSSSNTTPPQLCPKLPLSKSSSSQDSKVLLPTKSRSKRRRIAPKKFSLDSHQSLLHFTSYSPDPLLHYQTCWLAESELLLPIRKEEDKAPEQQLSEVCNDEECENETSLVRQQQQPIRRCAHCLSNKTPQWRAGPLGPKTLCNACGVSYKKGRLLPEYRPAKSPTFVSYKHSNSYKKVMEMRMAVVASSGK